jgi:hypothetical protein
MSFKKSWLGFALQILLKEAEINYTFLGGNADDLYTPVAKMPGCRGGVSPFHQPLVKLHRTWCQGDLAARSGPWLRAQPQPVWLSQKNMYVFCK